MTLEIFVDVLRAALIVMLCGFVVSLTRHTDRMAHRLADLQIDHAELTKLHIELERRVQELSDLLPRDNKGEVLRHELLLRQMNDEMEKSLRMEEEWNKGLQGILSYGKPIAGEDKT